MNKIRNRWFTTVAAVLFAATACFAQKHDYVWLSGYGNEWGFVPQWGTWGGTTIMDFNEQPVAIAFDSIGMNFNMTNASISDEDGNLQCYTNGIFIANGQHEPIENSDSLNAGYVIYELIPYMREFGYRTRQGALILPNPTMADQYYILHSWIDSASDFLIWKRLYYTLIDMSLNNGRGKVLEKNTPLIDDWVHPELTAVKTSGDEGWWIPVRKQYTDCYYMIKLSTEGFDVYDTTCVGTDQARLSSGATCFSPDGTKYALLTWQGGLSIYDFDRCTGKLSNERYLSLPWLTQGGRFSCGLSFSPNGRFLYLSAYEQMYQFDLNESSIFESIDTVGFQDSINYYPSNSGFTASQIAPDGKIYVSLGLGDTVYHVINNPDGKGQLCDLRQHSFRLKSIGCGVPNFPNYRLGAMPMGACDTLTSVSDITEKEKILNVFPNPASDVVTVDYGYTDWSKGGATMEITNNLGQVIYSQSLPMYSGFQKLQVANYASGSYTVYIKRKGMIVATGKLVKE